MPLLNIFLTLPAPSTSRFTSADAATSWLSDTDNAHNTALHHASAAGELKTVRLLIVAGADDKALNAAGWSALAYSASVAAEVYLRRLVQEREAGKVVEAIERSATVVERDRERRIGRDIIRVVSRDDGDQANGLTNDNGAADSRYAEMTRARTAT